MRKTLQKVILRLWWRNARKYVENNFNRVMPVQLERINGKINQYKTGATYNQIAVVICLTEVQRQKINLRIYTFFHERT